MLGAMVNKDLKTSGIVLRRTNYGEADRILNLITPVGKVSAIAKGVRKEKSKLAGNIEMFSLTDYVIHFKNSEMGVITSARMIEHYGDIIKSFDCMELAAMILKRISRLSENNDNEAFFDITKQSLMGLNNGVNMALVEGWFLLKTAKASGEEVNLYRDVNGEKLQAGVRYDWNGSESAFYLKDNGEYGTDEIKMLRLMQSSNLNVIQKVKVDGDLVERVLKLARVSSKL